MKLKKYIFILFTVLTGLTVNAQTPTEVHAVLDSNSIRIGAQTKLDLYLSYDASTQKSMDVLWPLIEDTIQKGLELGLEPVSDNPIDLVLLKNREMQKYLLANKWMAEMKEKGNGEH